MHGKKSGRQSGNIIALDTVADYGSVKLYEMVLADYYMQKGDSGAPITVYGTYADLLIGVHSGGIPDETNKDDRVSRFSKLSEVKKTLNLDSIYTVE